MSGDVMNMSKENVQRNRIRAIIKNYFKKRSCACVVRRLLVNRGWLARGYLIPGGVNQREGGQVLA